LATEEKLLEEQENDVEMVATEDENNIDHSKLSYIKI
jgi:large subunit ribosomal protein L24e